MKNSSLSRVGRSGLLIVSLALAALMSEARDAESVKEEEREKEKESAKTESAADNMVVPVIVLKDLSILDLSFTAVSVGIDLSVDNQNKKEIVVEHIQYALKLDKVLVKSGTIHQVERFPAKTKRDVHVPVMLPFDENIPSILSAIRNMSAKYQIYGKVKIQGRSEPLVFSHSSELK